MGIPFQDFCRFGAGLFFSTYQTIRAGQCNPRKQKLRVESEALLPGGNRLLILTHQAAVAFNIGAEDGGESTVYSLGFHTSLLRFNGAAVWECSFEYPTPHSAVYLATCFQLKITKS